MYRKILLSLFIIIFLNINIVNAKELDGYTYTGSKGRHGLTYEITDIKLNSAGLSFDGWAFIRETSHYDNFSYIDTDIVMIDSNNKEYKFNTTESTKYNLTSQIEYNNKPFCSSTDYNEAPSKCNYRYDHVSFSATIPLSYFTFPNKYEFYILVSNSKTNIKRYTKVYSPNEHLEYTQGNKTYVFDSDIDLVDLKMNSSRVLLRTQPNGSLFSLGGYNYYYNDGSVYTSSNTKYVSPLKFFQLNFISSSKTDNGRKIAMPGNSYKAYASSVFLDYLGAGGSTLYIKNNVDASIENITYPLSEDGNMQVHVKVSFTDSLGGQANLVLSIDDKEYIKTINTTKDADVIFDVSNITSQENICISVLPESNSYVDTDNSNNQICSKILKPSNKTSNIKLKDSGTTNEIELKDVSGISIDKNKNIKYFYETSKINVTSPVTHIQEDVTNLKSKFDSFYSGGSFTLELENEYTNDYPFYSETEQQIKPQLYFDNKLFDLDKELEKVEFIKKDDKYVLPTVCRNDKVITYDHKEHCDSLNRLIYTNYFLPRGTYDFKMQINDIGLNENSLDITSFIKTKGILFGKSPNSLFYMRLISSKNPKGQGYSELWTPYSDHLSSLNSNGKYISVFVSKEAKATIKEYVLNNKKYKKDFNDEFSKLINTLIKNKQIKVIKS